MIGRGKTAGGNTINYFRLFLIVQLSFLFITPPSHGARNSPKNRPKIGLVLSGGGARGGAHIGVLRALEELNIPIDFITATSMGAIVGGFYATGMTASEIEDAFNSIDWHNVLADNPPRQDMSFRRKLDDIKFLIPHKLGFNKGKVTLPKGFIQGQKITLVLKDFTQGYLEEMDFDDLPIPFRAVAMDLEAGKEIAISSGELARAIRASMSLHGVFSPVEMEGRLLVDGGYINNLPINVARAMGADVVIAIDIGTPLKKVEDIASLTDVSGQVAGIGTRRFVETQLKTLGPKDFLITPNITISLMEFSRATEMIPNGYNATIAMAKKLKKYSLPKKEYAAWRQGKKSGGVPPLRIDHVKIDLKSRLSEKLVRSRFRIQNGDILNLEELKQDIANLYGMGYFDQIDYHIEEKGGETTLTLETIDKSWGPNYLQFGLNLESDMEGRTEFTLGSRYTMTELNKLGAELQTDLQIGQFPLLGIEYLQPLDYRNVFFIAPKIEFKREDFGFRDGDIVVSEYRVNQMNGLLKVGNYFGNWGEFTVGINRGQGDTEFTAGKKTIPETIVNNGFLFADFRFDELNRARFPTQGPFGDLRLKSSKQRIGADSDYDAMETSLLYFKSFGKNTFSFSGQYGTVYDGRAPFYEAFSLGGFLSLSGYPKDSLQGQNLAAGRLIFYRQMAKAFGFSVYLGGSVEKGNVWDNKEQISFDSAILAGSAFIGFDTPLGPLFFAYGRAEDDVKSWTMLLGKVFSLTTGF